MEWLLKIVEGPMKGAEIALVEGVAVSFGSGDACDVIVQDATVPEKACEFEVDATGVRMAVGGGSAEALPAFEIRSFGTTSFAVGPVSGEWQSLIKPVKAQLTHADTEETKDAPGAAGSEGDRVRTPAAPPDAAESSAAETRASTSSKASCRLLACCCALVVLAALVVAAWYFWPQIVEKCPKAETVRLVCVEKAKAWYGVVKGWCGGARGEVACKIPARPAVSLDELARQHGLKLEKPATGNLRLTGNLKRRTERLAIRALALAADPSVTFDLTDDETLLAASSELVFACSDGALKVTAASNRTVTLAGYAPSAAALERAIRALNADVKGIDRLDTSRVTVGGTAPAAVAKTPFVREAPPGEHPVVAIPAHTPEPPLVRGAKARDYPIAGILTTPYPCVVMRNGVRLVEGAQLGKTILVKIEADRLTLNDGGRTVEWKP